MDIQIMDKILDILNTRIQERSVRGELLFANVNESTTINSLLQTHTADIPIIELNKLIK